MERAPALGSVVRRTRGGGQLVGPVVTDGICELH